MDSDFYLISTKLDQDHWHVQNAIMHFMEVMTLDKLAFEKTTLTVLNSFLKSVTDSVVDSLIDIVAEKIPIFKIASIGIKAYRDAKAEYEKSIEAHESLNLVNFINQYRISYTKYHERIKSEVFPEIAKVLRDMLKKASNMEAKKFLAFLIHMISKFVIQFISKPLSWYVLQLCKRYIEINKGFIVMAVSISYYNKETRSILVNPEIFKIRNKKAPNLEKLLNEVITEGEISSVKGIIDLPIKKIIYLLDEEKKAFIRNLCTMPTIGFPIALEGGYPRCLYNMDPNMNFLKLPLVFLNEGNSLEQPIKDEAVNNMWQILRDNLGALRFKNFSP
jgi:hypothetical protein